MSELRYIMQVIDADGTQLFLGPWTEEWAEQRAERTRQAFEEANVTVHPLLSLTSLVRLAQL